MKRRQYEKPVNEALFEQLRNTAPGKWVKAAETLTKQAILIKQSNILGLVKREPRPLGKYGVKTSHKQRDGMWELYVMKVEVLK